MSQPVTLGFCAFFSFTLSFVLIFVITECIADAKEVEEYKKEKDEEEVF